ncbi:MAG TPA: DEAD/DEAH box helicase, partial [Campylobacterales bacterium]|nr:DEAD/DEAH box helicase [Campylobacterales bacterium]
ATESKEELEEASKKQEKLAEENAELQAQIQALKAQIPKKKVAPAKVEEVSEKETRQNIIDLELEEAGFEVAKFKKAWDIEYPVTLDDGSRGYVDYVIWGEDGNPLAVIEAKKTTVCVSNGRHQAQRYSKALEKQYGCDLLTFLTNGRVIEYSNGDTAFREIHSIFPAKEMQRLLKQKRAIQRQQPSTLEVDEKITDRGYQKRVIKAVLKHFESGQRRAILVMATGTGKTRVSASLSDILIRAGWVNKILFLADRKELVKQATNDYASYLSETTVNLLKQKELSNRCHFGTYETVHNLIDKGKYNAAFFDLIIVDEAHRTIYKKYRAIFEYFDAFVLGLTATPADEVHRNTYNFFNAPEGEPTESYGLRRAIEDGYLVDFEAHTIDLGIVKRGVKYDELSEEEKEEYEAHFDVDEEDEISSSEVNKRLFNQDTNDQVLHYLNDYGLKVDEGNSIGKTIIFAKNQDHAVYIKERYDLLFPNKAHEAKIIHSAISHVEDLIDNFKKPHENPRIAISVDMLDTGIDVPEILNLVFFKPIKSKIKFWQMIGRGTRLSPNKTHFKIFDFCGNFEFFDIEAEGLPSQKSISLKERLFLKRIKLLQTMPKSEAKEAIKMKVSEQLAALNPQAYNVKKHRHTIEKLQQVNLDYLSDEVKDELKIIAEYIEDTTLFHRQQFEMIVLNAQEKLCKEQNPQKELEELTQRAFVLKSKAHNIKAIEAKEKVLDEVLENEKALMSLDALEAFKEEVADLANLSLGKKRLTVKSDFRDSVEEVRILESRDYIRKADIETEVQKVFAAYIERVVKLNELESEALISEKEINEIKHHVFDYETMVEERVQNQDDFKTLMQEVMNSTDKMVANTIFENYVESHQLTQKQIEVTNAIKNTLFGKKYVSLENSLKSVNNNINSEIHPLASMFEGLNEDEKELIYNLMMLLLTIEKRLNKE